MLVPASKSLTLDEMTGLSPYDDRKLKPWQDDASDAAREVSELSRRSAMAAAEQEMARRHGEQIVKDQGLLSIRTVGVGSDDLHGQPVMVPIWIGVARYRDVPYRIVVNGQTGKVVGEAPLDRVKIALISLVVIAVVVGIVYWRW